MKFFPFRAEARAKTYTAGTLTYTFRGLVFLFAWLMWGDFCFTLMEAVVPTILPLKLRSLGSSNALMGLIMTTIPAAFNLTVTPIVSFKSDRFRSRWGRRIPFILATMPFLVAMLVFLGLSDDISKWVFRHFFAGSPIHQAEVSIVLVAIFMAGFALFNMFVGTVFTYLFVDVIPQEMLGRFNGWFSAAGTLAGACYNFFIFQYAETHAREIFLGAALLYLVGFGLVCLKVKEGQYPPIDDGIKNPNFFDDIRIYARECFTSRYYWDIFLFCAFSSFATCILSFMVFFYKSLGLDLAAIGELGGWMLIALSVCLILAGPFVDKCHPMRVTAYLAAFEILTITGYWVWLCIAKAPPTDWYVAVSAPIGAIFAAPFLAVKLVGDRTQLMVLLPHQLFGQFAGAMCLVRAAAIMSGGMLAGVYIDMWHHLFPIGDFFYRFNFTWLLIFLALSFYFRYRNYRAWKRLGGSKSYTPPSVDFRLADLPRRADDDGQTNKKLLLVPAWCLLGLQITALVWVYYYCFVSPNRHHALVFLISFGLNFLLYAIYLKFIRFMERP